jgi:hypothetical protein
MLVELSTVELRYHAVIQVISAAPVTRRYGVRRPCSINASPPKYAETQPLLVTVAALRTAL